MRGGGAFLRERDEGTEGVRGAVLMVLFPVEGFPRVAWFYFPRLYLTQDHCPHCAGEQTEGPWPQVAGPGCSLAEG